MSKDKPRREQRKAKTTKVPLSDGAEMRVRGIRLSKGQQAELTAAAERLAESIQKRQAE